ncbi:hypothetical protein CG007_02350 [Mesoplasma entomophilum]|uniref:Uncharacterized protein n=1 Tax=Mesoplasma coleopterae TaxID=324078 RepID=A0A2K8P2I8_9MOLU|nr:MULTISPECIES: hypothetical protein [Mesoplasma]ATZ20974.1 hypothetical protein MCOLE_v1c04620 [Mesoplasma coleopterae]AVN60445.1 hypothetical protein CG007_02350 [Mesoplasma entomophilum]AVN63145.1 hypothetical protein CG000_02450 [Mesoplasma coleopterae]
MEKLKVDDLKEIKGGAASGALLNGIGSIIGKTGDFIIDVAMLPFAYIEAAKGHDKAKFKMGSSSFEFDDTTSIKLNANSNIADNVIKLEAIRSFDNSMINQGNNLETAQLMNTTLDTNMVKEIVFNKYFG